MRKQHFIYRYFSFLMLALASFFIVVMSVDQLVKTQQAQNLLALEHTVVATPASRPTIMADNHVRLVTSKTKDKRAKMVADLVAQNASIVGKTVTIRRNGQAYLVAISKPAGQLVSLWQRRQHPWTLRPQSFFGLSLIYLLLVVFGLWQFRRRQQYWVGHINQMQANLARIRKQKPVEPLLLTPGSPFLALGSEVNKLGHSMRHLRRKLLVRQASFDQLIDHLPQGVMVIDAKREVVLANQAMATLLGKTVSNRRHNYLADVKTYALARMIEHTFKHTRNHHEEVLLMTTNKHVDANVVWLHSDARHPQVMVILYDVTYLRQIEKMQLDFVSNVSHELKTPVTAISGFAETLLQGAKDDPEALAQFLQIIYDESSRLTSLINDILTLSRPQNAPVGLEPVALEQMVQAALVPLKQPIEARQLTVNVAIPEDIQLMSDTLRLTQVVRNLINNAVYYNRDQGSVTITAKQAADKVVMTVTDTGVGLTEEDQNRVFERFYRADKARSRHNGGTGLGLAIVKDMVNQLDGDIQLSSQVGVGTTFRVILPTR